MKIRKSHNVFSHALNCSVANSKIQVKWQPSEKILLDIYIHLIYRIQTESDSKVLHALPDHPIKVTEIRIY